MASTYKSIDVESWDRKDQFHLFSSYDDPFFGFTADCDFTKLYAYTKEKGYSFFAAYLFASQLAVNSIPELKYRLRGDELVEYSEVSAGSTVLKDNNVFTFCYFKFIDAFSAFNEHVKVQVETCRKTETPLLTHDDELDQIYYSVIPWIHFKSVTHPRKHGKNDSVPRITFGKMNDVAGKWIMPISVEAHHGLLDGFHLGIYYQRLQNYIDQPELLLER